MAYSSRNNDYGIDNSCLSAYIDYDVCDNSCNEVSDAAW